VDELPQLINVLRGDMSLVGPRPCTPFEFELFSERYKQRCEAPPGLTGAVANQRQEQDHFRGDDQFGSEVRAGECRCGWT
jgi:lipopolysaccharide/colanic/teichoic acid biosynthesis glycosyltransferase